MAATAASAQDNSPPSVPTGVRGTLVSPTTVELTWNPSSDNVDVAGYAINLHGMTIANIHTNKIRIAGLTANSTFPFRVSAFDAEDNQSAWSAATAVVTTPDETDEDPPASPSTGATFSCAFENSPRDCGFGEQAKASGRAALTQVARDGGSGVVLRTLPGDSNVAGSGTAERNDLTLSQAATGCTQGQTQWWSHSVRFPNEYIVPPSGAVWHWGLVFDFHHTGLTGQANFQIVSLPSGMEFWVAGGPTVVNGPNDPGHFSAPIGPVVKNTWYDFVYNIKWSSGGDGFIKAWVNGVLKMDYKGPTLYTGQGCYLKLANYHSALGAPVSVIHDRVKRGTSAGAVSDRALQ